MCFGLYNDPATAKVINLKLNKVNWKIILASLDDVFVLGVSTRANLDD
jgi:hypothetical protein